MKRRWITFLITGLYCSLAFAQEQRQGKIVMFIKDVETPTTRAAMGKYLDVKTKTVAYEEDVLTDEDRATLDPKALGKIRQAEVDDRIKAREDERKSVKEDNLHKKKVAETLRQASIGSQAGRNIVQAREWLSEAIFPYNEFIEIVDRSDQETAMDETARNSLDQTMRGGVTHYIRVIVGDTKENKTTAETYGVKSVKVKKSLNVSVAINDLNDRQAFNRSFNGELSRVHTSHGGTTGGDDHEEMLQSALKQAGEAIGKHFTARLTVEVLGPKDEGDSFNAASVNVTVDEQYLSPGSDMLLLKGPHTVKVESDDYMPVSKTISLSSDMPIKIPLVSAWGYVKLVVPTQLGFDCNDLVFELSGRDGSSETLYGEGPHRIKKAAGYILKTAADGYQPYENKALNVSGGTEEKPTTVNVALRPVAQ